MIKQLHPRDAETLRHLRAAVLAGRPVKLAHPGVRAPRRMYAMLAELERLAAQAPASIQIEDLTDQIRGRLSHEPVVPGPAPEQVAWEHPAPPNVVLNAWLREARRAGYTLEALGEVAGVTRERIRQLVAKAENVQDLPPVHGQPPEPEDLPWPEVTKPWHRWPRPQLSEAERDDLLALHDLGRQCRGTMAVDDPRRAAGEELARRVHVLIDERHFTAQEVADVLGLTRGAIWMKLRSHGFRKLPPSMKRYKGEPSHAKGDRPIDHGTTRSEYARCARRPGGSCEPCRQAERDYYTAYRAKKAEA